MPVIFRVRPKTPEPEPAARTYAPVTLAPVPQTQAPQVCPVCESCPPPAPPERWSPPTAEIDETVARIRAYYARDARFSRLISSFAATPRSRYKGNARST